MSRFILLLCLILFIYNISFGQEIVIKFSDNVEVAKKEGEGFYSNQDVIQNILIENSPQEIKKLFQETNQRSSFFKNVQLWEFNNFQKSQAVLNRLQKIEGVIYAEPNRVFKISEVPNDFYYSEQWYLPAIKLPEAWEQEKGNSSVIAGVIDTGIDYTHEDLQGQLWINHAEDLNQNGKLDSMDINGIDDDNNGYVDDVIGWDFTNAPNFPDQGDYLDPDNDPMDEYLSGHGTAIAGIINARQNNQIGISGIAPGIKVMALRAGTASGFLEEDDVAEAIIYGVENGCKIINMSFGDNAFSYLIHDAIVYGKNNGVLFVASSGNDGNSILQYPAAYDETISVGAIISSNTLAGFSSYGNKLNLVAPGQDIFSCQINNSYGSMSGTSFSAPIVSAAAALIWSHHPNYSLETVKGALYSGCKDLGFNGWDTYYGHGVVDVNKSLSISNQGFAEILFPALNDGIASNEIAIIGTVFGPNLISYLLKIGIGENPNDWSLIREVIGSQAIGDTLAIWNTTGLADTVYTIELQLKQFNFPDVVCRTQVYIDHTPPQLNNLSQIEMQMGPDNGVLLELDTDDLTQATLYYGESGTNNLIRTKSSQYFQNRHYFTLSQNDVEGMVDYYIQLENSASLKSVYDNDGEFYHLNINNDQPAENIFSFKEQYSITGYLLSFLTDFNSNQFPEIVISSRSDSIQYGPLQIWEYQNQQWNLKSETNFNAIPRDVGDVDNDGHDELLAGFGGTSLILEIGEGMQFPNKIAWIDTSNFWGSRLVNLDEDQPLELLAIKNGDWCIFDLSIPGYQPILKQKLVNSTNGDNRYGIPWSIVADLDQDGLQEIIIGDYDGDILIFEDDGLGYYQLIWTKKLPGTDATYLFQAADLNGDERGELVTVVRNEPENPTESNTIAKYWDMSIWQAASDNNFELIYDKRFHEINSQRNSLNGLSVLDLNEDGISEIFFTPFPKVYQIGNFSDSYAIGWYREGINTNAVLQFDLDSNSKNDILINTNDGLQRYESEFSINHPLPPAGLTGTPQDTNLIYLKWRNIPGADYYKIYRKSSQNDFTTLDSTENYFFEDKNVIASEKYTYAITQVNHSFLQPESPFSNTITVQPNAPPKLDSLLIESTKQIILQFNEPMSDQIFDSDNFVLIPQNNHPISVVRGHNKHLAILSFKNDFTVGQNYLFAYNLADQHGTPFPDDTAEFSFLFNPLQNPFYLKEVNLINKEHLRLKFSNPVDQQMASQKENYLLEPDGNILSVQVDTLELTSVDVFIDKRNRMGSLGVPYYIQVQNLKDVFGNVLDIKFDNRLIITKSIQNLSNVIVFPTPYNLKASGQPLRFANLPMGSEVFIFTSKGQFIRKLKQDSFNGGIVWDLKTDNNELVSSGVYLYIVRFEESEVKGKFLIIR